MIRSARFSLRSISILLAFMAAFVFLAALPARAQAAGSIPTAEEVYIGNTRMTKVDSSIAVYNQTTGVLTLYEQINEPIRIVASSPRNITITQATEEADIIVTGTEYNAISNTTGGTTTLDARPGCTFTISNTSTRNSSVNTQAIRVSGELIFTNGVNTYGTGDSTFDIWAKNTTDFTSSVIGVAASDGFTVQRGNSPAGKVIVTIHSQSGPNSLAAGIYVSSSTSGFPPIILKGKDTRLNVSSISSNKACVFNATGQVPIIIEKNGTSGATFIYQGSSAETTHFRYSSSGYDDPPDVYNFVRTTTQNGANKRTEYAAGTFQSITRIDVATPQVQYGVYPTPNTFNITTNLSAGGVSVYLLENGFTKATYYWYLTEESSSKSYINPGSNYRAIPRNATSAGLHLVMNVDDGYQVPQDSDVAIYVDGVRYTGTISYDSLARRRVIIDYEISPEVLETAEQITSIDISSVPVPSYNKCYAPDYYTSRGTLVGGSHAAFDSNHNSGASCYVWWTEAGSNIVMEGADTFQKGESYTYHAILQADDGYTFKDVRSIDVTINGSVAGKTLFTTDGRYLHVYRTFKCPADKIDGVEIYGLTEPVVGETAVSDAEVAEGSVYELTGQHWEVLGSGGWEEFTGTFQPDTYYTYVAYLTPASTAYEFAGTASLIQGEISAETIAATVNGTEATYRYYTSSNRQLKVERKFYVPDPDAISHIELSITQPRLGDTPETSVTSNTAGVEMISMGQLVQAYDEEFASAPILGDNTAYYGLDAFWLEGDQESFYGFRTESDSSVLGPPAAVATTFEEGQTYTLFAQVDLGDNKFAFDGNTCVTTITVNGMPAEFETLPLKSTPEHTAVIRFVYHVPQEGYYNLYFPANSYAYHNSSGSWSETVIGPSYIQVGADMRANVYTRDDGQPEGQQFYKWVVLRGSIEPDYQNYYDVNLSFLMPEEDVVLDYLTCPEGTIIKPISARTTHFTGGNVNPESGSFTYTYDGTSHEPHPTVIWDDPATTEHEEITLVEGVDYVVSYEGDTVNASNDNNPRYVITGIGEYEGTLRSNAYDFRIDPAQIGEATTVSGVTFTGEPATPPLVVTGKDGTILTEGVDYEVEWHNNTHPTTSAYARVTGIGNYTGWADAGFAITSPSLKDAIVIAEPQEFTYNGSVQYPTSVTLVHPDFGELQEGVDWYIPATPSVNNAGDWSFTIYPTSMSAFVDAVEVPYTIKPLDISDPVATPLSLEETVYEYWVTAYEPRFENPKDQYGNEMYFDWYTGYTYSDNVYPGTATVVVTPHGDHTGSQTLHFDIRCNMASNPYVEVSEIGTMYANGSQLKPRPTVSLTGGGALTEGVDYELVYGENTEVGTGTVTIRGLGDYYYNEKVVEFSIQELPEGMTDISGATVTVDEGDYRWSGSAIEPHVTVTLDGVTLSESDYEVSYSGNVGYSYQPSTAIVYVTGKGDYVGTTTGSFMIGPRCTLEYATYNPPALGRYNFTGSEIKPEIQVSFFGEMLQEGTDYEVVYTDNVDATTSARATIVGKGRFEGSDWVMQFVIDRVDIGSCTADPIPPQLYTGGAVEPVPTLKLGDYTLVEGTDYSVMSYYGNYSVGWAEISVQGLKNFTGYKTIDFQIVSQRLDVYAGGAPDYRYETARMINDSVLAEMNARSLPVEGVIVVAGRGAGKTGKFPDALSAAGLSGVTGYPVVMVDGATPLSASEKAMMAAYADAATGTLDILILGDNDSVSAAVEAELEVYGDVPAGGRLYGKDGTYRYGTNYEVWAYGAAHGGWNKDYAFVAKATDFPDALSIAPFLAANHCPLVLVDPAATQLTDMQREMLSGVGCVVALGDHASVSAALYDEAGCTVRLCGGSECTVSGSFPTGRYGTSAAIVAWETDPARGSARMFAQGAGIATGTKFPDALGSATLLGLSHSVLVLCDPTDTVEDGNAAMRSALTGAAAVSPVALLRVFGGPDAATVPETVYAQAASAVGWGTGYAVNEVK